MSTENFYDKCYAGNICVIQQECLRNNQAKFIWPLSHKFTHFNPIGKQLEVTVPWNSATRRLDGKRVWFHVIVMAVLRKIVLHLGTPSEAYLQRVLYIVKHTSLQFELSKMARDIARCTVIFMKHTPIIQWFALFIIKNTSDDPYWNTGVRK